MVVNLYIYTHTCVCAHVNRAAKFDEVTDYRYEKYA